MLCMALTIQLKEKQNMLKYIQKKKKIITKNRKQNLLLIITAEIKQTKSAGLKILMFSCV